MFPEKKKNLFKSEEVIFIIKKIEPNNFVSFKTKSIVPVLAPFMA